MSVMVDGKELKNVESFSCCEYGVSITQSMSDEDSGMTTRMYTSAGCTEDDKKAIQIWASAAVIPKNLSIAKKTLVKQIEDYLKKS